VCLLPLFSSTVLFALYFFHASSSTAIFGETTREQQEVATFLASIGLEQYKRQFWRHKIALGHVPLLTKGELEELGLPIGDQKTLELAYGYAPYFSAATALAANSERMALVGPGPVADSLLSLLRSMQKPVHLLNQDTMAHDCRSLPGFDAIVIDTTTNTQSLAKRFLVSLTCAAGGNTYITTMQSTVNTTTSSSLSALLASQISQQLAASWLTTAVPSGMEAVWHTTDNVGHIIRYAAPRLCLLTAAYGNYNDELAPCLQSLQAYASNRGYTLTIQTEHHPEHHRLAQLHGNSTTWDKMFVLRDVLNQGECDGVFFLDADAAIRNFDFPLESLFSLMSRDQFFMVKMENSNEKWPNTGAMLLRNGPQTLKMLSRWLEEAEVQGHLYGEQGALPVVMHGEFARHTVVLPPDPVYALLQNMPVLEPGADAGSQWILHGAIAHKSSFCAEAVKTVYGDEVYSDWTRILARIPDVAEVSREALRSAPFWKFVLSRATPHRDETEHSHDDP